VNRNALLQRLMIEKPIFIESYIAYWHKMAIEMDGRAKWQHVFLRPLQLTLDKTSMPLQGSWLSWLQHENTSVSWICNYFKAVFSRYSLTYQVGQII